MLEAVPAHGRLPQEAWKPGPVIALFSHAGSARSCGEAADAKDHPRRIHEGVRMRAVQLDGVAGAGDSAATAGADERRFALGSVARLRCGMTCGGAWRFRRGRSR